jgi:D-glycerate 3-kinase
MSAAEKLVAALGREMPGNLSAAEVACQVAEKIVRQSAADSPALVGINGAQGSGKSTLARLVAEALERFHGQQVASLSLDDFYLSKVERERLAREVHPLCRNRGVPGTHDVELLTTTIDRLAKATPSRPTLLPRFDKLADDRMPFGEWPTFVGRPDVILLEGWSVGIRAADLPAYAGPINALERTEDPDGEWFRWSLHAIAQYKPLWDRVAPLVSIEVPDFETVIDSRLQQEEGLAAASGRAGMDRYAVTRFVEHYERYTRALWSAMPARANMLFRRNRAFGFTLIEDRV